MILGLELNKQSHVAKESLDEDEVFIWSSWFVNTITSRC